MARIWLNVFPACAAILLLMFVQSSITYAQNAPPFPERQWLEAVRSSHAFPDGNYMAEIPSPTPRVRITGRISHSPHALAWGSAPNVFRSNRFNGLPAAKI